MLARLFPVHTAESVTSGHPDKVCDQVSDALLDAYLERDPESRVALECFGAHGLFVVGGEVAGRAEVDHAAVARAVYREIGYADPLEIVTNVVRQSPLSMFVGMPATMLIAAGTRDPWLCLLPFVAMLLWCGALHLYGEAKGRIPFRTGLISFSMLAGVSSSLAVLALPPWILRGPEYGPTLAGAFFSATCGALWVVVWKILPSVMPALR